MSTRSVTKVFDGDSQVAAIYRHHDGYPEGHGKWLIAQLADKHVVNGYSSAAKLPEEQRLNGPGRVAAFIVAKLFEDGHDPDILSPGVEAGVAYEYKVKCPPVGWHSTPPDGLPLAIECYRVTGGYGDKPLELVREPLPSEGKGDDHGR